MQYTVGGGLSTEQNYVGTCSLINGVLELTCMCSQANEYFMAFTLDFSQEAEKRSWLLSTPPPMNFFMTFHELFLSS